MTHTFPCAAAMAIDGDTLRCRVIGWVRLARIDDVRELHIRPRQRCLPGDAKASRDNLARLIAAGPVRCTVIDAAPREDRFQNTHQYERPVGRCLSGDRSPGKRPVWGAQWL